MDRTTDLLLQLEHMDRLHLRISRYNSNSSKVVVRKPGASRDEPIEQADRDYHANRSRGLGGNPTTGAEENLLGYPGTRYFGEHIFVHEFSHAIMSAIRQVDTAFIAAHHVSRLLMLTFAIPVVAMLIRDKDLP